MNKKLYLITRGDEVVDYDEFDSMIVCETSEEEARKWIPSEFKLKNIEDITNMDSDVNIEKTDEDQHFETINLRWEGWIKDINQLKSIELGIANENTKIGVVLASYNAG